jgi:hypothetical protein
MTVCDTSILVSHTAEYGKPHSDMISQDTFRSHRWRAILQSATSVVSLEKVRL